MYFYPLVDFNHSLDSVYIELVRYKNHALPFICLNLYATFIYFSVLTEFKLRHDDNNCG